MMIPVSFALAALSLALAIRLTSLRSGSTRSRRLWQAFFLLTAIEALLVGLRFGYDITTLAPIQAMLPLFFAPLLYLGFAVLTRESQRIGPHLLAAAALSLLPQIIGPIKGMIDVLIVASYGFYLFRLLLLSRAAPDRLPLAPAETAEEWALWLRAAALLLGFVLVLDLIIAVDFALADGANAPWMIALGTLPIMGGFLWFGMSLGPEKRTAPTSRPAASADDQALALKLEKLIQETSIHRDPDLSVSRLARRLGVPIQDLSRAVNRTHAMNVSQWVNRQRIEDAAGMIRETDRSLAEIHQTAGFLSRSNFYREFQRVYGQSPGEFRSSRTGSSTPPP